MRASDRKKQRQFEVLKELVNSYIDSCVPVSSDQICRNLRSGVSPATIRNTLTELDELGWTRQPYSSSGRVPSSKGYRAYIDLLKPSDLSRKNYGPELVKGLDQFEMSSADIGPGLQKMADLLSELSGCLGVVLSPQFENDFIREIKLLPVDHLRVLVVLVSGFGLISTEIVQIDRKLSYFSQKRIEEYLNTRLHGRSTSEDISVELYSEEERAFGDEVYNEIFLKYLINMRPRSGNKLFLEGLSRVFENPELQVPRAIHSVIEFFEDRDAIIAQLRQALSRRKTLVSVGDEMISSRGNVNFSMIASPYKLNSINVGVVGVIGPMRLQYSKLIPLVKQSAELLSERLAANFRKPRLSFDRDIPFKII